MVSLLLAALCAAPVAFAAPGLGRLGGPCATIRGVGGLRPAALCASRRNIERSSLGQASRLRRALRVKAQPSEPCNIEDLGDGWKLYQFGVEPKKKVVEEVKAEPEAVVQSVEAAAPSEPSFVVYRNGKEMKAKLDSPAVEMTKPDAPKPKAKAKAKAKKANKPKVGGKKRK